MSSRQCVCMCEGMPSRVSGSRLAGSLQDIQARLPVLLGDEWCLANVSTWPVGDQSGG